MKRMISDIDLSLMLFIRAFEKSLLNLFDAGQLNGTTHTCLGQEIVPVALQPFWQEQDYIFSNHRGHGHYLARFNDPEGLLAEITGRAGAVCQGAGGSQHIRRDRYFSTGIQGESLSVGVGSALAGKRDGENSVTFCFIGDGTWGEGAVYEALNLAGVYQVPLIVVVENNAIAQSTPTGTTTAGTIKARAEAFGLEHHLIQSNDLNGMREELTPLIDATRSASIPRVIEFAVPRLGPHSKGDDTRSDEDLETLQAGEWYSLYQGDTLDALEQQAQARMQAIVSEVLARPLSTWGRG